MAARATSDRGSLAFTEPALALRFLGLWWIVRPLMSRSQLDHYPSSVFANFWALSLSPQYGHVTSFVFCCQDEFLKRLMRWFVKLLRMQEIGLRLQAKTFWCWFWPSYIGCRRAFFSVNSEMDAKTANSQQRSFPNCKDRLSFSIVRCSRLSEVALGLVCGRGKADIGV